jgi:formiminotetrahydrofolate cyclodeaminase
MFKSEIDVELHKVQMEKQNEYLGKIEAIYSGRIAGEKLNAEKWESEIKQKEARFIELENMMADEMNGKRGNDVGVGAQTLMIKAQMDRQRVEINNLKVQNAPLIKEAYKNIKKFEADKQKEIRNSELVANGLDGLLERIKLAHKIAGTTISLFITLLFMAIELTPIFFKLMLTKTPYDYLEENVKELIKAEEGILVEYNFYKDKKGLERDLVINYAKEKLSSERKALLKAQKELSDYAITRYTEDMKQKIDTNPNHYVQSEPSRDHEA